MPQATGALTKIVGFTQPGIRQMDDPVVAELLYIRTLDYSANQPLEQDPTLAGGYRGQQRGARGRVGGTGSAAVTIGTSIAFWLKHLIGKPTTTGAAGAYTHTFQVGSGANALPAALGIERDYSARIATPGRYVRDTDLRIASGAFAFSTAAPTQQATFNLVGAALRNLPATPVDDAPEDYGHAAFALAGLALELDDGATQVCIETLNLNWDNDLDTDLYCLNDGGLRHDMPEGQVAITGDGVAQFDTPALLTKAQADANLKLKITMSRGTGAGTAGNEQLVITIPLSTIEATTPGVTGPRGIKQNFNFIAYRPAGAEVGVTAVLKSARATV
ncbi:phage tail tube protein [Pseudoxanthomonas sp. USHLN014]|uniref:phage tail tube protein n=1 Tax=Pseudoxanthomonas sp. USHLN014 TaxID=3081297 RepID=UPI00301E09F6